MLPKKKIVTLSKKKLESELKKQKDVLKERSPLEKAKQTYHETVEGTPPAEDSKDLKESESASKKELKETKPEVRTADLSKMVDNGYEKLQRTSRGLAAAASVFLGETFGTEASDDSEVSETQTDETENDQKTAVSLARKILERKKREKSD